MTLLNWASELQNERVDGTNEPFSYTLIIIFLVL